MPAGLHLFQCETCKEEWRVSFRPRRYEGDDQVEQFIPRGVAWCHACNEPQDAEELPDLRAVLAAQQEVETKKDPLTELLVRDLISESDYKSHRPELREYFDTLLEFLRTRDSPSRCLDCGSIDIEFIWKPGEWRRELISWYEILADNLVYAGREAELAEITRRYPDYEMPSDDKVHASLRHPGCGGMLIYGGAGLVNIRMWTEVYSKEGLLIGNDAPGGTE